MGVRRMLGMWNEKDICYFCGINTKGIRFKDGFICKRCLRELQLEIDTEILKEQIRNKKS